MDNIFVKWGLDASDDQNDRYLSIFHHLNYKKICFFSGDSDFKDVVLLKRFLIEYDWNTRGANRLNSIYYNDYVRDLARLSKSIDILKLLNGEEDYFRER